MAVIKRETLDQPDVRHLLDQADARSASLYATKSRFGSTVTDLLSQGIQLFVARQDGRAVGCGGYVPVADCMGELKRIFVVPEARGQGIGRQVVIAIEQAAAAQGLGDMLLETGVKSVEAIGLYHRLGYTERGPFGSHRLDPLSIFMEKQLTPA